MIISLHGISASKGLAIGKVYVLDRGRVEVQQKRIPRSSVDAEVRRLRNALKRAREQLHAVKGRIPPDTTPEVAAFIDTHLLMLEDSALSSAPIKQIRSDRCNAEWALKVQRDALVSVFDAMDDPYLRTRRDDVHHVVDRVLRLLIEGRRAKTGPQRMPVRNKVVFADDLSPADTVLMQHQGVLGFLTEFGGPTSHTAILARSLRIPAVVGLHHARSYLTSDDMVIVDGRDGVVLVNPDAATVRHYQRLKRTQARKESRRKKLRSAPAVTSDGERVGLQANVELPSDLDLVGEVGAAGIGLYRTEFLFMNRDEPPDEEEQYEAYRRVVAAVPGGPVTIRTLDLGADKQVDGARPGAPTSSNPALGLRAVRLCLKEHSLFKPQLRAILRVSADHRVRMMIPMLSSTQELAQVFQVVRECERELDAASVPFDRKVPIGAMIEVPAAAVCADIFARQLDFLSIGTNDLIQYTIAIDRVDDEVNYLYDPLHPAVLRLIQTTIKAGQRTGIPVAMCGEMAGDSRYTRLLLGLGLREFSVHPNALLEVKQVINESHVGQSRKLAQRLMRAVKGATRDAIMEVLNESLDV